MRTSNWHAGEAAGCMILGVLVALPLGAGIAALNCFRKTFKVVRR